MKAIPSGRMDSLETVSLVEGTKQISEYFRNKRPNRESFERARLGAAVISGYARLRASETNRMAVELSARRDGRRQKK
jgi:hypothetical protein